MKHIVSLFLISFVIFSCNNNMKTTNINAEGAISIDKAFEMLSTNDSTEIIKITGNVKNVCQGEGCWMTLETNDGKEITFIMSDNTKTFDKNSANKQVVFEGKLYSIKARKQRAENGFFDTEEIEDIKGEYFVVSN